MQLIAVLYKRVKRGGAVRATSVALSFSQLISTLLWQQKKALTKLL